MSEFYKYFPILTNMEVDFQYTSKRKHMDIESITNYEENLTIPEPDSTQFNAIEEDNLIQESMDLLHVDSPPSKKHKSSMIVEHKSVPLLQGSSTLSILERMKGINRNENVLLHTYTPYTPQPSKTSSSKLMIAPPLPTAPLLPPDAQGIQMIQPFSIFPYQLDLVYWMYNREKNTVIVPYFKAGIAGGILAVLMGMGKTLIMAYLCMLTLKEQRDLQTPTLYVCPANLIGTVHHEFFKFFGSQMKIAVYHHNFWKSEGMRLLAWSNLQKFDIIIVSYDTIVSRMRIVEKLRQKKSPLTVSERNVIEIMNAQWYRIILDESQDIRNENTLRFKFVSQLKSNRRFCMSGTPISNGLRDIYLQLLFCGLELPQYIKNNKQITPEFFQQHLLPHLQLRDYSYVDKALIPKREEHVMIIPQHPTEAAIHKQILHFNNICIQGKNTQLGKIRQDYIDKLKESVDAELSFCVAAHLLQREKTEKQKAIELERQKYNLTGLTRFTFTRDYDPWIADFHGEAGYKSSKLTALYNLLHEIKSRNEKAIIFANYVRPLEFALQGWNHLYPEESNDYRFIHGSINATIRERLYCEFRTDPNVPFLFSTLKLGNRGLNLIEGNHIIFVQPWYRWSHIEQGIYRCFRIGQKRTVFAHFLLSQNTSDERIFQKARQLGIDNQNAMVSDSALASDDPDEDNDDNVDISSFF